MIIQRCPRCGGNRIRRGYRRTPWWWAVFGRYNLLCNSCNWEFVGLAVPGTVPEHVRKRQKQSVNNKQFESSQSACRANQVAGNRELSETINLEESNDHRSEIASENLSVSEKHFFSAAKPLLNVKDNEGLDIESTNLIELNRNEIKRYERSNETSGEIKFGHLSLHQDISSHVKRKKRSRVKKKK